MAAASALAASALAAAAARREDVTSAREQERKRLGLAAVERDRTLNSFPTLTEENNNRVEGRCVFCEGWDTLVWEQQQSYAPWRLMCEACGGHQQGASQQEQHGASTSSGGGLSAEANTLRTAGKSSVPAGTVMQTLQGRILQRERERGEQRERDRERTEEGPNGQPQGSGGGQTHAPTPHFPVSLSGSLNRLSNSDEHERSSCGDKRGSLNGGKSEWPVERAGLQQHKPGTLEWECSQNDSLMSQLASQEDLTSRQKQQLQQLKQQQQSLGFLAKMKQDIARNLQGGVAGTVAQLPGSLDSLLAQHPSSTPAEQQQQPPKDSTTCPLPLQALLQRHIQQAIQKSPIKLPVSSQLGSISGRATTATDPHTRSHGPSLPMSPVTVAATISEIALGMAKRREQANGPASQQAAAVVSKGAKPGNSFMFMYGQHQLQKHNIACAATATAAYVASCAATAAAARAVADAIALRGVIKPHSDIGPGGGDMSDVECVGDFPASAVTEQEGGQSRSVPTSTSAPRDSPALPSLPQVLIPPTATTTPRSAIAQPAAGPSLKNNQPSPATTINTQRPIPVAAIPSKAPVVSSAFQRSTPAVVVPIVQPAKQQYIPNVQLLAAPFVPNNPGIPVLQKHPVNVQYNLDMGVRHLVAPSNQPLLASRPPTLPLPAAQNGRPSSAPPSAQTPFPVILAPTHATPAPVRLPAPVTPSPSSAPTAAMLVTMQKTARAPPPILTPPTIAAPLPHPLVHRAEPPRMVVPTVYVPFMHARLASPVPSPAVLVPPRTYSHSPVAPDGRNTVHVIVPSAAKRTPPSAPLLSQPIPSPFADDWSRLSQQAAKPGVATIPASTAAAITIALAAAITAAKGGGASAAASALTAGRTAAAAAASLVAGNALAETQQPHQKQAQGLSSDQTVRRCLFIPSIHGIFQSGTLRKEDQCITDSPMMNGDHDGAFKQWGTI